MHSILEKSHKAVEAIKRNGVIHLFHLGFVTLILPFLMELLPVYAQIRRHAWTLRRRINADRDLHFWRLQKEQLLEVGARRYRLRMDELEPDARYQGSSSQGLQVIAMNGFAGLRKHYDGDKLRFLDEVKALYHLALAGCNVSAILDVDFDCLAITTSYVSGPALPAERMEANRLVDDMFAELKKAHASLFILHELARRDFVVEERTGKPYLVGLGAACHYPHLGERTFGALRDRDVERFNHLFNAERLTYKRAKQAILRENRHAQDNWYAPVYFGAGLRIGPIWKVDRGYGRWRYILKNNLPPLGGKRVLDLGANNAFNSIQMLRHGAAEAIGMELDGEFIAQGNLLQAVFEWADNARYNFHYVHADMAQLPDMDLGRFDLVLALCCLYYLDDEAIARLIQHVSTITGTFVVQCSRTKTADGGDPHIQTKASVAYNLEALRSNGFPDVSVIAPRGYSRPLLIARKDESYAN
jgi:hypothetical protein